MLLLVGQYIALTWLAPRYVVRTLERLSGGKLLVGKVRLSFPLTTTLTGLRLAANTDASALSIQRIVIKPRWCSLPSRTLWLETLEVERPLLRLRRTAAGTILWPKIPESITPASSAFHPLWQVQINAVNVHTSLLRFE